MKNPFPNLDYFGVSTIAGASWRINAEQCVVLRMQKHGAVLIYDAPFPTLTEPKEIKYGDLDAITRTGI